MLNEISPEKLVAFLNELIAIDPEAMTKLFTYRTKCNDAMAEHSTVQVDEDQNVSFIGIINGLCGVNENGWGYIAANFEQDPEGNLAELISVELIMDMGKKK